jgi:hypothetical protein
LISARLPACEIFLGAVSGGESHGAPFRVAGSTAILHNSYGRVNVSFIYLFPTVDVLAIIYEKAIKLLPRVFFLHGCSELVNIHGSIHMFFVHIREAFTGAGDQFSLRF